MNMSGYAKSVYQKELSKLRNQTYTRAENLLNNCTCCISREDFEKNFFLCNSDFVEYYNSFFAFYNKKERDLRNITGKHRYSVPKIENLICDYYSTHYHENEFDNSDYADNKLLQYIDNCQYVIKANQIKLSSKHSLIQFACPRYIQKLIGKYSHLRLKHSGNEHARLQIVKEVSKYKSKTTVSFLYMVNESEPVYEIRHIAFLTLQRFGLYVRLRRVKKRLRSDNAHIPIQPIDTPNKLSDLITIDEIEKMKHFNIFISHSSKDREFLIDFVHDINRQKKNVYIDWMEDLESLPRTNTNVHTAEVIQNRIKASDVVLCVKTEGALLSEWIAWEIGYAMGIGKKVYLLDKEPNKPILPFMHLCTKIQPIGKSIDVNVLSEIT